MSVIRVILLAIAAGCFVGWLRRRARANSMASASERRIAEAGRGYVQLYGVATAIDGHTIRDPIQDVECLWFRIETAKLAKDEDSPDSWIVVRTAVTARDFDLRDSTGHCRVVPEGARVKVESYATVMVNAELRHRVWRIVEGESICVVGELTPAGNAERFGGGDPSSGRVASPLSGRPFLISDHAPAYAEGEERGRATAWLVAGFVFVGFFAMTL